MTTRKNIMQPADWWREFERDAQRKGISLSEWLGEAGRKQLPADARKRLSARKSVGRPKGEET